MVLGCCRQLRPPRALLTLLCVTVALGFGVVHTQLEGHEPASAQPVRRDRAGPRGIEGPVDAADGVVLALNAAADPAVHVHTSGPPGAGFDASLDPLAGLAATRWVDPDLRVQAAFAAHLETLPPIPKLIHLSWSRKNILEDDASAGSDFITHGVGNLSKSNPGWKVTVSDDAEMDRYIQARIAPHDWELVKDAYVVERGDLWRLLKMFHEGGYYQDLDRLYNRGPIDSIVLPATRLFLPWHADVNVAQDLMVGSPGNAVFAAAIRLNLVLRRGGVQGLNTSKTPGKDRVLRLGPRAYFHAVTHTVFGVKLTESALVLSKPPGQSFDEARNAFDAKCGWMFGTSPGSQNGTSPVQKVNLTQIIALRTNPEFKMCSASLVSAAGTLRAAVERSPRMQSFREQSNRKLCNTTFAEIADCGSTFRFKAQFNKREGREVWSKELKDRDDELTAQEAA